MSSYEYKVVPAPVKGKRARGVQGAEGRFAHSLETLMNEMAAEGWEYQRAETLPSEEKSGLTSTQTVFRNVLIFRRLRSADLSAFDPRVIEKDRPLLLAAEGSTGDTPPAEDSNRGLSGLLRRRAARVTSDDPAEGAEAPDDDLGDLAARVADPEDGPEETAQNRPAAE